MTDSHANRFPQSPEIGDSASGVLRWIFWISASVSTALLLWYATTASLVTSETTHLAAGIASFRTGEAGYYRVNPPVHRLISAIPVEALVAPKMSRLYLPSQERSGVRRENELGRQFIVDNQDQLPLIMRIARYARIPFVVLGGWLILQTLYHQAPAAAYLAGTLWFASPLVIGHGWVIEPDVVSAVAAILLFWSALRWRRQPTWDSSLVCGLAWGVAIGTKYTFCPLYLLWPLLLAAQESILRGWQWKPLLWIGVQHVAHGFVALIFIWILFGFEAIGVPLNQHEFASQRFAWASAAPQFDNAPDFRHRLAQMPSPFPKQMLVGIDEQTLHFEQGFSSYLLGVWRPRGVGWYYAVGYLIKENVVVIFAAVIGLLSWLRFVYRPRSLARNFGWHESSGSTSERLACLVFAVSAVSVFQGVLAYHQGMTVGVRYVLPMLPFLYIALAVFLQSALPGTAIVRSIGMAVVGAVAVVEATVAFPNHYAYANGLFGGTYRTPPALHGTNFDGGQDLHIALRYLANLPESQQKRTAIALYAPLQSVDVSEHVRVFGSPPSAADREAENMEPIETVLVSRGLLVPNPWQRPSSLCQAGYCNPEQVLASVAALPAEPDAWLSPTLAIYHLRKASATAAP